MLQLPVASDHLESISLPVDARCDTELRYRFWQSWQAYPVNAIPTLVRDYRIIAEHADGSSTTVVEVRGNHLRNRRHPAALDHVTRLRIEIFQTQGLPRVRIYAVRAIC